MAVHRIDGFRVIPFSCYLAFGQKFSTFSVGQPRPMLTQ